MTKAPERIWAEFGYDMRRGAFWDEPSDQSIEYLHIDHALDLVAVEREAIAAHIELLCRPISEAGFVEFSDRVLEIVPLIRARTNPDAQAALESRDARIRNEVLEEAAEIAEGFDVEVRDAILALITEGQSDE